ncbi:hypothetical protein FH972_023928 [Carpinus fangiana]|uniref:Uncharacterized protein n=1 Tax=Carpinus fangiana TaxID=176857 RepID=A0A5N6KWK3_9ROSI|nr:hypothetical protein FH972_023928 [Carpinus fangiana]
MVLAKTSQEYKLLQVIASAYLWMLTSLKYEQCRSSPYMFFNCTDLALFSYGQTPTLPYPGAGSLVSNGQPDSLYFNRYYTYTFWGYSSTNFTKVSPRLLNATISVLAAACAGNATCSAVYKQTTNAAGVVQALAKTNINTIQRTLNQVPGQRFLPAGAAFSPLGKVYTNNYGTSDADIYGVHNALLYAQTAGKINATAYMGQAVVGSVWEGGASMYEALIHTAAIGSYDYQSRTQSNINLTGTQYFTTFNSYGGSSKRAVPPSSPETTYHSKWDVWRDLAAGVPIPHADTLLAQLSADAHIPHSTALIPRDACVSPDLQSGINWLQLVDTGCKLEQAFSLAHGARAALSAGMQALAATGLGAAYKSVAGSYASTLAAQVVGFCGSGTSGSPCYGPNDIWAATNGIATVMTLIVEAELYATPIGAVIGTADLFCALAPIALRLYTQDKGCCQVSCGAISCQMSNSGCTGMWGGQPAGFGRGLAECLPFRCPSTPPSSFPAIVSMDVDKPWQQRLLLARYSRDACLAALRGEAVPHALGDPVHRLCVIRGIRYHPSFGSELHGVLPVFTRALNARSIMSNVIPDFDSPDAVPYCIWHPQVASEQTYRQLVGRYPHMVYQVGRACAVAGYINLYKELDILPDAHIAEEARECGHRELFDLIMSQPVRYSIMDDYELRVKSENRQPVPLNGDTAVRWMLDVKQGFKDSNATYSEEDGELYPEGLFDEVGFEDKLFNITEDMNIDEHDSDYTAARLLVNRLEVSLLSSPLPTDLPTVQKDLLITMAAYTGDVDRYARLRRPRLIANEVTCCIRGIYHSSFFAIWWSQQPGRKPGDITTAINARFIMSNVLSRAPHKPFDTPYLIWWPTIARPSTYRRLATLQPDMLPQIVHAAIYASYKALFDELLPQTTPDRVLLEAAELKRDTHYLEALQARVQALGTPPADPKPGQWWKRHLMGDLGRSDNTVLKYLDATSVGVGFDIPYNGRQCDGAVVETVAMLPDAWRLKADDPRWLCELDYDEWPPGARQESAD